VRRGRERGRKGGREGCIGRMGDIKGGEDEGVDD